MQDQIQSSIKLYFLQPNLRRGILELIWANTASEGVYEEHADTGEWRLLKRRETMRYFQEKIIQLALHPESELLRRLQKERSVCTNAISFQRICKSTAALVDHFFHIDNPIPATPVARQSFQLQRLRIPVITRDRLESINKLNGDSAFQIGQSIEAHPSPYSAKWWPGTIVGVSSDNSQFTVNLLYPGEEYQRTVASTDMRPQSHTRTPIHLTRQLYSIQRGVS